MPQSLPPFLCLRRGVSPGVVAQSTPPLFSLPTQRCFLLHEANCAGRILFSAYAEVFRPPKSISGLRSTFLCLRRGVSVVVNVSSDGTGFSLPTQRCFRRTRHCDDARRLFSAYAEVFLPAITPLTVPRSFLCLRRGVSIAESICIMIVNFSLPTQRCFPYPPQFSGVNGLFSAYAEVFLLAIDNRASGGTFLCLRRGVSLFQRTPEWYQAFSLPTQRCFCYR